MLNMLLLFFKFVLFCKITDGLHLSNGVEYHWHTNFTNVETSLKGNGTEISPRCKEHLLQYLHGVKFREKWALTMFDAGAKLPPSGILDGNVVDLGSFDECLDIEQHDNGSQIIGKYCIGSTSIDINLEHIQKRSVLNPYIVRAPVASNGKINIQLAKCFPDACSAAEIATVYAEIDSDLTFDEELCQTKASQPRLDVESITGISVFGFILGLVVISTAYDLVLYYTEKEPPHSMLIAFSAFTNGKRLLNTSKASNGITCLHGIRVISTMWIILDHKYSIQYNFPIWNEFYYFNWVNGEANMFMLSATLAVDTFLLLSGLLISYNYMGAVTKGVKFNVILHYVHRYLRLTPVLAAMVVFHITLLRNVGSGPLWPNIMEKHLIEGCETHWWKALLYVQNIFGRGKSMCVPHSWYLSADMQLFIVSPFLLLPLQKWPKLTLFVIVSLTACSMIACFLIGWFFDLNAFMQGNDSFAKQMDYVWYYYFPIHTRAAPWLIGIIMGYIIFECMEGKLEFLKSKVMVAILWMLSLVTLCACVFSGHGLISGGHNRFINSLHIALVRPVWVTAISWIIFACFSGYGGPVNWFLSLPIFQVVSRLTYTLYLVHYTLIYILTAQMRTTSMFNNFQAMYTFWGDFACTMVISIILTLAIEFPVISIDKWLFAQREKRRRELQIRP